VTAAILRFLAAAEILETDLCSSTHELGGSKTAKFQAEAKRTLHRRCLQFSMADMAQYIHDNTEDELTTKSSSTRFWLEGRGHSQPWTVSHLAEHIATGAQQIGRLTNLMQLRLIPVGGLDIALAIENPDFGDTFDQAVPTLMWPAFRLPDRRRLTPNDHIQAIANTAGFHFGTIEQGGNQPLSIPRSTRHPFRCFAHRPRASVPLKGAMHFQTWSDKAGNAPALTDPKDSTLVFPTSNSPPAWWRGIPDNLIMARAHHIPEPKPASVLDSAADGYKGAAMER